MTLYTSAIQEPTPGVSAADSCISRQSSKNIDDSGGDVSETHRTINEQNIMLSAIIKACKSEGKKHPKWKKKRLYKRSKHEYKCTGWIAYTILQTTQALSTFIVIIWS